MSEKKYYQFKKEICNYFKENDTTLYQGIEFMLNFLIDISLYQDYPPQNLLADMKEALETKCKEKQRDKK